MLLILEVGTATTSRVYAHQRVQADHEGRDMQLRKSTYNCKVVLHDIVTSLQGARTWCVVPASNHTCAQQVFMCLEIIHSSVHKSDTNFVVCFMYS